MGKLLKNNLVNFWAIFVVLMLVLGLLFFNPPSLVKGASLQLLPANYSGDWYNQEAVLLQDLGPEADFEEFNQENSAYIVEEAEETPASPSENFEPPLLDLIASESVPFENEDQVATESEEIVEPPSEETPIEEPLVEEAPTEELPEKTLEFSGFSISEDFSDKVINNVQLRFSLAGKGEVGDELVIDYYHQDSWQNLAELNLENEISNATNGGYFLYALPVFENWQDLGNLKIRFQVLGSELEEIYLDAAWLEIEYQVLEEVTPVLPEEQPQLPPEEEILPPPEVVKILQKYFSFFLESQPIKSKKYLDWHPKELAAQENLENSEINVRVESEIIFSGACQKKYYVILMYRQPEDYDKNPALFIYNKAFLCQNGAYEYTLNDLPSNLKNGTYYFLVAEEGETGPWQPITAIQPVRIGTEYR